MQDYKPPKDNDKYDEETRRLHSEGCAPARQIPPENIKREDERNYKKSSSSSAASIKQIPGDQIKRERHDSDRHRTASSSHSQTNDRKIKVEVSDDESKSSKKVSRFMIN